MLQSVPAIASAKPRLLATFPVPTFIIVQIVGPNTLYLAETDQQLMLSNDNGKIDALQLTQAGAPGGLYFMWWQGDLWAAGSVAFQPQIVIPGPTTGSMSPEGGVPRAYGIEPTKGSSNR